MSRGAPASFQTRTMKAVDKIKPKLSSCAAACRGFARLFIAMEAAAGRSVRSADTKFGNGGGSAASMVNWRKLVYMLAASQACRWRTP